MCLDLDHNRWVTCLMAMVTAMKTSQKLLRVIHLAWIIGVMRTLSDYGNVDNTANGFANLSITDDVQTDANEQHESSSTASWVGLVGQ